MSVILRELCWMAPESRPPWATTELPLAADSLAARQGRALCAVSSVLRTVEAASIEAGGSVRGWRPAACAAQVRVAGHDLDGRRLHGLGRAEWRARSARMRLRSPSLTACSVHQPADLVVRVLVDFARGSPSAMDWAMDTAPSAMWPRDAELMRQGHHAAHQQCGERQPDDQPHRDAVAGGGASSRRLQETFTLSITSSSALT